MWLWRATLFGVAGASEPSDWIVDQWDMRDGMPQNSVTDILQDQDGYIWLTTYGGLARFDGREFLVFHQGNTPGLGARFTSAAESPDGTLWFGSEAMGLFRLKDGTLEPFSGPTKIWDVACDGDGQVWVASKQGLHRVAPEGLEAVDGFQGVRSLSELGDGSIIATANLGQSWCLSGGCADLTPTSVESTGVPLWFRAPSGALRFSIGAEVYEQTPSGWEKILDGPEHSVFPLHCTRFRGEQYCAQEAEPFPLSSPHWGEPGDAPTRSMLVDRSGGLWVGTDGGGLLYYQHRDITRHHNQGVFGTVEAPDGTIWFTTSRSTLHLGPTPAPWGPESSMVWASGDGEVFALREDRIWRVSAEGVQEHPWYEDDSRAPAVGPCFEHGQTLHAFPASGPPVPVVTAEALGASELVPLRCDRDGAWVSLDQRRLVRLRGDQIVEDIDIGGGVLLRDITERDGWLWVASYGDGLLAIRDDTVKALTPSEGMCDYAVSRLFDLGEELWVNTNHGAGMVSWSALLAAVEEGAPLQCQLFASGEGNANSGVRARDGVLWLPTISGVAEVHPDQLRAQAPPMLYLDAVRYAQAPIQDGAVVEGPGELDVRFVGLYYTDPHAVLYRYRLLGQDERWSEAGTANRVRYAALQPGEYRFEVQARGRSGQWTEPVSISFLRIPLWYEHPLVRVGLPAALVAAVVGGLLLGLRQSIRQNQRLADEIAERQRVEEALRRKQDEVARARRAREAGRRLEALGRLAGGIAHDFNNLMTVLSMHTSLLSEHPDPEVREEAEGLLEVLERATALTRQLLVFGRSASAPEVVELGSAVEAMVPLLERLIRADITLRFGRDGRSGVQIDPGRLEQIVTNLVLNARDAIEGAGTIRVSVSADGAHAVLSVADDGSGMPADVTEHIFEPYFTTKALSDGTGLGMATVHGAVQEAGGSISVQSAPGQGTTVRVLLPLCPLPASPAPADTDEAPASLGALRVLIVDDRAEVLRAVAALAGRLGCSVVPAADLDAAVAAAQAQPFDLLLTDVVMPNGDGPAVQAAVRQHQPGLPTVFMTGYADEQSRLGEGAILLRKPFSLSALRKAVQRALG